MCSKLKRCSQWVSRKITAFERRASILERDLSLVEVVTILEGGIPGKEKSRGERRNECTSCTGELKRTLRIPKILGLLDERTDMVRSMMEITTRDPSIMFHPDVK